MKILKIIFIIFLLLVIFNICAFSEESDSKFYKLKNRIDINIELMGNGFYLGMNIGYFFFNNILTGVGVSFDVFAFGYHAFIKYFFFNSFLNFYYIFNFAYEIGLDNSLGISENFFVIDNGVGASFQIFIFYISADARIRFANNNFSPWFGLNVGIRI